MNVVWAFLLATIVIFGGLEWSWWALSFYEFHDLDLLLDRAGFELINLTFTKILKDFEVVHIHPNNCSKVVEYGGIKIPPVIEITFLRKDRITSSEWALEFPHPLDRINVPRNLDIPLPKCWYGAA